MSRIDLTGPRSRTNLGRGNPVEELRKRAVARLTDRLDPAKNKFKPLSILRMEARRALEQFFDAEIPGLPRADRDRLVDEVLAEVAGLGPLEELFRDELVQEFMVLAHNQVIARKGEHWLPVSVSFPSVDHYRAALLKMVGAGEPGVPPAAGGFQVKLGNGFRLTAVIPPAVLDTPPLAAFARIAAGKPDVVATPPPVAKAPSGTVSFNEPRVPAAAGGSAGGLGGTGSTASTSGRGFDPFGKIKQKVTEKLIERLSAYGVYDLNKVPGNELQLAVMGFVEETLVHERMSTSHVDVERLTREIMKGMQR